MFHEAGALCATHGTPEPHRPVCGTVGLQLRNAGRQPPPAQGCGGRAPRPPGPNPGPPATPAPPPLADRNAFLPHPLSPQHPVQVTSGIVYGLTGAPFSPPPQHPLRWCLQPKTHLCHTAHDSLTGPQGPWSPAGSCISPKREPPSSASSLPGSQEAGCLLEAFHGCTGPRHPQPLAWRVSHLRNHITTSASPQMSAAREQRCPSPSDAAALHPGQGQQSPRRVLTEGGFLEVATSVQMTHSSTSGVRLGKAPAHAGDRDRTRGHRARVPTLGPFPRRSPEFVPSSFSIFVIAQRVPKGGPWGEPRWMRTCLPTAPTKPAPQSHSPLPTHPPAPRTC